MLSLNNHLPAAAMSSQFHASFQFSVFIFQKQGLAIREQHHSLASE